MGVGVRTCRYAGLPLRVFGVKRSLRSLNTAGLSVAAVRPREKAA